MWVLLHQHAVFEGARFALITVATEIARLVVLSEEAPFHACGETRSAAPTESRFLDHVKDLIGLVLSQSLCQRFIAAVLSIDLNCVYTRDVDIFCYDKFWHIMIP